MYTIKLIASAKKLLVLVTLFWLLSVVLTGCSSFLGQLAGLDGKEEILEKGTPLAQPLAAAQCPVTRLKGADKLAAINQALNHPDAQQLKEKLEAKGLKIDLKAAKTIQLAGGLQVLIPFEAKNARGALIYANLQGEVSALALLKRGKRTVNLKIGKPEQSLVSLGNIGRRNVLKHLRKSPKFKVFEQKLMQSGHRLSDEHTLAVINEEDKRALIALAVADGLETRYQYRIKVGVKKWMGSEADVEVEAAEVEPVALSCGDRVVETSASKGKSELLPLTEHFGSGEFSGIYVGPQTCVWGWELSCTTLPTTTDVYTTTASTSTAVQQTTDSQPSLFIREGSLNLLLYGFKDLDNQQVQELIELAQSLKTQGAPAPPTLQDPLPTGHERLLNLVI